MKKGRSNLPSCPNCGTEVGNEIKFCPNCSAAQEIRPTQPVIVPRREEEYRPLGRFEPEDFSNLRGCFHYERPPQKMCTNCGQELCYECFLEEELDGRVMAFTSIDTAMEKEFGYFCPACYIDRTNQSDYRIPRGINIFGPFRTQNPKKPPNPMNPFSYENNKFAAALFLLLFVLGIVFFTLGGFIFLIIAISLLILDYNSSKKAYNEFATKKQKAMDLLNQYKLKG